MTMALHPDAYRDESWYQSERENIWSAQWLMFCAASEVKTDGSYCAGDIAGFPIAVVRQPGADLTAFVNICPHRAGPIFWNGSGKTGNLVCRYHGWSFDWTGDLISARDFGESDELCPQNLSLQAIDVDTWNGMVFIRINRGGPDLLTSLGGLTHIVNEFPVAEFSFAHRMTRELKCNWKTYVDNYLEGYHVPLLHPSLARALMMKSYKVTVPEKGYCHHTCDTAEGSPSGGAWLFGYPNLAINVYADGMNIERIIPVSRGITHVVYDYYTNSDSPDTITRMLEMSNEVLDEDQLISEQIQKNLDSGVYRPGPLSPKHEICLSWFQNRVQEAIGPQSA